MATAQATEDRIGHIAEMPNVPEPGLTTMRTPASPTTMAAQRRTPMRSPRIGIDRMVTNSGDRKLMVVALASGSACRPVMNSADEPTRPSERTNCRAGLRDRSASPRLATIIGSTKATKPTHLSHAISIGGSDADSTFEVASEHEKIMPATRTRPIAASGSSVARRDASAAGRPGMRSREGNGTGSAGRRADKPGDSGPF